MLSIYLVAGISAYAGHRKHSMGIGAGTGGAHITCTLGSTAVSEIVVTRIHQEHHITHEFLLELQYTSQGHLLARSSEKPTIAFPSVLYISEWLLVRSQTTMVARRAWIYRLSPLASI